MSKYRVCGGGGRHTEGVGVDMGSSYHNSYIADMQTGIQKQASHGSESGHHMYGLMLQYKWECTPYSTHRTKGLP